MIPDLAISFGPGMLGLAFTVFLASRFRRILAGEIWSEYGQAFNRAKQPSWYWFYVGVYTVGFILGVLSLLWGVVWVAYLWEYRS